MQKVTEVDTLEWAGLLKDPKPADTFTEPAAASDDEKALDGKQRRLLRYCVAGGVGVLLLIEILGILLIIVCQGLGWFNLNEWVLGFFVNGVILQTFGSLHVIVTHLFPDETKSLAASGNPP